MLSIEQITRICYEMCRAYDQKAEKSDEKSEWERAEHPKDWERDLYMAEVEQHIQQLPTYTKPGIERVKAHLARALASL